MIPDPSQPAPEWFWPAVETESSVFNVSVADCDVHYRTWGEASKPGLLLAHGMNAHSRWWDFIAPHFMSDYYIVALDFTGMGDSDFRYDYTPAMFADEIAAVIEDSGMGSGALVGHSFGGFISVIAANRHRDKITKLILLDSAINPPKEPKEPEEHTIMGGGGIFPDAKTARARFRLQPPQPCNNQYLIDYIARHSIMRVDAGWTWKFDEDLRDLLVSARPERAYEKHIQNFKDISQPLGLIYGAESNYFDDKTLPYMQSLRDKAFPAIAIKNALHHLFVDQPMDSVAAIRTMLTEL